MQLSNILFLVLPPILMHLFKDYGHFVNPGIHLIWVLMIVVGLSSAYFHATLSLIGQLLDELAILWVCTAAFALFFPKKFFPRFLKGNRLVLWASMCESSVNSVWINRQFPSLPIFQKSIRYHIGHFFGVLHCLNILAASCQCICADAYNDTNILTTVFRAKRVSNTTFEFLLLDILLFF